MQDSGKATSAWSIPSASKRTGAPKRAVARQEPGTKRATSGERRSSPPGGMVCVADAVATPREERTAIRCSRSVRKPSGPATERRSTPSPSPVARSVTEGCARAPVARSDATRPPPDSAPEAASDADTSPAGSSRLCSNTGTRASSPGARKRGSAASASTASRTTIARDAEPTRSPSHATAISRSSPAKSGRSSATVARPSGPVATGPAKSATLRRGIGSAPSAPNSSPPWRSVAAGASVGSTSRP